MTIIKRTIIMKANFRIAKLKNNKILLVIKIIISIIIINRTHLNLVNLNSAILARAIINSVLNHKIIRTLVTLGNSGKIRKPIKIINNLMRRKKKKIKEIT